MVHAAIAILPATLMNRFIPSAVVLALALAATGLSSLAATDDWPQYLGAGRDGVYRGVPIADAWPATGPRVGKKPLAILSTPWRPTAS
jgi:hypothetical protein